MSIPHFSALSAKRQRAFMLNPDNFIAQEKLDGSNMRWKFDSAFPWASRKTKNGPVYKTPDEWGTDFWVTGFRAAHTALNNCFDKLQSGSAHTGLTEGSTLEMELLFAPTPNTIVYNDDFSTLVIYDPTTNTPMIVRTNVTLEDVPYTTDGYSVQRHTVDYQFSITSLAERHILGRYKHFRDHLLEIELTAEEVEKFFIDKVRRMPSMFTRYGREVPIEGLVFKHRTEGWMFKIVDREWFTKQNRINYEIRNKIFKSPRGHKNSIMDQFWAAIASGTSQGLAAGNALKQLDELHKDYMDNGLAGNQPESPHIRQRNLITFASVRSQLNDYATGKVKVDDHC